MKNDMTWERSDNSEQNKQQAARPHGNLVGVQSKTPSSIIHHPSSISSGNLVGSRSKTIAHCVALALLLCVMGCAKNSANLSSQYPIYTSYQDIPGVSAGEIEAIEALKGREKPFIYGMNLTTETFYDENGAIRGYSALFCEWLSQLFGIPFEPAVYEWGDLIEGLENGAVDFTGELTANRERRQTYFMSDAIAERSIKYMRLAGSEPLLTIQAARSPRYAFLEGATTAGLVSPHISGDFEIILIDDYDAAYTMLKNGQIDAFFEEGIAEAAFDRYGDVMAEDFFPLIYAPVSFTTQNPALSPVVSVVQRAIAQGGTRHLINLYNAGQREYMRHKIFLRLSAEEHDYIRQHNWEHPVPVAMGYDTYPTSFYNTREKAWQGIAIDVLAEIEELTGLAFERVNEQNADWPVLLNMLQSGDVAMVMELIRTAEREGRFLWTDSSYQTDYYALLSKSDYPELNINEILFARVALIRDTAYAELFRTWFPDHGDAAEYANTGDAFAALERGEVDLVMATVNLLLSLTNYQEQAGYKANIVFNRPYESSFGFNRKETLLCSIIDKALRTIETGSIAGHWTRKNFDYREKVAQSRLPWLFGTAALLACILVLLLVMSRRNRQTEKRTQAMLDATPLACSLWDRNGVMLDCNQEALKLLGVKGKSDYIEHFSDLNPEFQPDGEATGMKAARLIKAAFETGYQRFDWMYRTASGEELPVETVLRRVPWNDGYRLAAYSRDMRSIYEQERAVKKAEDASTAKSLFLATMSHEIRTPLNAIISMSDLMRTDNLDTVQRGYFDDIKKMSRSLLEITSDIPDF
jgi:ABC-type amino acid transport substrate-binding protein